MTIGAAMALFGTAPNYSAIIRPLQWLVIVVIWLFFLRIVRAVWVEVRPASARPRREHRRETRARRRKQLRLEVVEPPEYRGITYDIEDDLTIGRGPTCGVATAYDLYSSSLHARLFQDGDKLWVEDLGSTNGTFVNAEEIARPTRLGRGDLLQVGGTVFEVVK